MNRGLLIGLIGYIVIFVISCGIPIYLFNKMRLVKIVCVLIAVVLSVGLINVYFLIWSRMGSAFHPLLNEFQEVFWLIPPIIVYLSCSYVQTKRKRQTG